MKYIREDMGELKQGMAKLTEVMTRMAVAEESQARDRRDFLDSKAETTKAMEKIIARIEKLEAAAPLNNQAQKWVERALWVTASAAVMYAAKKVGIVP